MVYKESMNSTIKLNSGVVLTLVVNGTEATMSGGKFGTHEIEGDEARITAHWRGYVEANGGKVAHPASVVAKQPVFVQMLARQFDVVCTPKFPSTYERQFTVRVLAWSKADANRIARRETFNATCMTPYTFKAFPVQGE